MGAYLTLPVREKESRDFDGDFLSFGASSMQGWRMTQEDAHSCQVDFDKENKTSLFAVYDGHGGAEVAQYSSMNLPNYLKSSSQYGKGDIKEALEEAFLGFDATLTEESVVRQLKDLAGVETENEEIDEEVKNEAAALCEEATMPLEKVLERYGGQASSGSLMYSLRKRQNFQSPMVKTKPDSSDVNENASVIYNNSESPAADSQRAELDEVKAKLEDKLVNGFCENDANKSQMDSRDNSSTEPASGHDALNEEPVSSSKIEPGAETSSEVIEDIAVCTASENGADSSGKQIVSKVAIETDGKEGSNPTSAEHSATESSLNANMETPGPSSSSASCSTNAAQDDEEDSEADTEEEEDDSEDGWNKEDAEDDSDDDEEAFDGMEFDDDDDDDDDEDEDEEDEDDEGEMSAVGWSEEPGADSGCTAVVALLRGRTLYVANAGDSRCVVSRDGMAIEMSADHKPEDTPEKERIIKAGGKVTCDGRVNGGLNLSRALGDHSYKRNTSLSAREQMITALPDVRSVALCEKDRFMVLACDGIWNVMSSQDVVDFVQRRLDSGVTKLSVICEEMFEFCLAPDTTGDGTGCDNMTCVIVRFNKLHDDGGQDVEASKKRKADSDTEDCSAVKRSREELDETECKEL